MLGVYAEFAEQWMALPVFQGEKTAGQRFPGAVSTYCIEAMMQDRKALQAGTSHFLGQNFAKASGIQFLDQNNKQVHAWTTSWDVSTRLIGGMIMAHGDDDGMVMPPKLAPAHVVILPVIPKPDDRGRVLEHCRTLQQQLRAIAFAGGPLRVELDARDLRGGDKAWQWVKKGVPIRIEIGPRDIEKDSVFYGRRDKAPKDKASLPRAEFVGKVAGILQDIQDTLYANAKKFREEHTRPIDSRDEFYAYFAEPPRKDPNAPPAIYGGFALAHFNGDPALERQIQDELGVTVRCIPLGPDDPGTCPFTGKPSKKRVVWARAY